MKEYQFEYTDQRFTWLLFVITFGIFLGLLAIFTWIHPFSIVLILVLTFGIPVIVFFTFKKGIKKIGTVRLNNDSFNIYLSGNEREINFKDINYYYYYDGEHGTTFTLDMKDGFKLKIGCNNNFCETKYFEDFYNDLKMRIDSFNNENNYNIPQLKTIFAKRITPYILVPATIIIIPLLLIVPFPAKILFIGLTSGLIIPWIKYIDSKLKNKII